ncbi:hypothetical protein AAK917_12175 [Oscillospiraceae bacterium 52-8]
MKEQNLPEKVCQEYTQLPEDQKPLVVAFIAGLLAASEKVA